MMQATAAKARVRPDLSQVVRIGLLGGIVALFICLIGIIQASTVRAVIYPYLSMGQILLLLMFLTAGLMAVRKIQAAVPSAAVPGAAVLGALSDETTPAPPYSTPPYSAQWLVIGPALACLIVSAFLAVLVLIGQVINLRTVLIQASPELYALLMFNLPLLPGVIALLVAGAVVGALVGGSYLLPDRVRRSIVVGLGAIPLLAIINSAFLSGRGVSLLAAIVIAVVGGAGTYWWATARTVVTQRVDRLPPAGQRVARLIIPALAAIIVLALPVTGAYPSQVLDLVGLYVLMGLGLNIVVGFAGLLDLGYVAFFALGAYTMGVLTSPEIQWLGIHLTFWSALPFSVLVSVLAGVILGIPVLGMRGDYLAIVTLGFGEIIRIVVLSDWLKPYIGGSNGITRIPRPVIGPLSFTSQGSLYYLIIAACLIAAFVAVRLKDSRLGRAWMALREDEDVAQAMGIDLVRTKLLAFATGAAFSGLAGAFFGTMITSIYPHSFTLLISINVLAVIIVGGMGSIPGVVLGAVALAGLPELLREFSEYRLWMFGAALVIMMLVRPEGLLPEARRRLELHEGDVESLAGSDAETATVLTTPAVSGE
jgi:branched-chain amino acid transport system permease protein